MEGEFIALLSSNQGVEMDRIKVAATQMSCSNNTNENIDNAEKLIRTAAERGAKIILIHFFAYSTDFVILTQYVESRFE